MPEIIAISKISRPKKKFIIKITEVVFAVPVLFREVW
jgi:hypothetical protein